MAVFGITALVGLFLFANFQGFTGGVKPVGPVTVWGTLPARTMQEALATLKQTHGELAKVSYEEKQLSTFDEQLSDAIASGNGPDLILISQEQLAAEQNKIQLISNSATSERTFRDTYLPEAELFLAGKGAYAIPFVLDPLVLYYNRTHLASVGAAVAPPTWEAVAGLSPVLTRAGPSPAVSALNYYLQFANPAKTSYSWNRSIAGDRQAFLAGDLSLYFGFASEVSLIAAGNPNLDFDMASVPHPATSETRTTYGRVYGFAIPKASANPEGALRTAYALSASEVLPTLARALHMVPAQRALLIPAQGDLYESVYFPQALVARGWLSPAPLKTDTLFATMVSSVTSGRQGVSDALGTLDQAISATFK